MREEKYPNIPNLIKSLKVSPEKLKQKSQNLKKKQKNISYGPK